MTKCFFAAMLSKDKAPKSCLLVFLQQKNPAPQAPKSLLAFVESSTEEPCTTSSQSLLVFLKTATEESCTTNRQILQENTANKPNAEFQTFTSSSLIHEEAGRENFCVQQPLAER